MSTKEKFKALAKENFNLEGFLLGTVDEVLETALQKVVDDSSNKFDDMAMAALYPVIEAELKAKISELTGKIYE